MDASEIAKIIEELKTKKIAMNGRDFLLTWEKSRDELEATFLVADALRAMRDAGISPRLWDSGIAVSTVTVSRNIAPAPKAMTPTTSSAIPLITNRPSLK